MSFWQSRTSIAEVQKLVEDRGRCGMPSAAPPARLKIGLVSFKTRRVSPRGGCHARACIAAWDIRLRAAAGEVAMAEKTTPDENNPIARRNFLFGASTAVAAGLAPNGAAQAQQPTAAAPPATPAPEPD